MSGRNRAHRGVLTRVDRWSDQDFEAFCRRQFSRVAATARAGHRRYVDRLLRLTIGDEFAVEARGYTSGGLSPQERTD